MLDTSNSPWEYEHYGDISVDFGSNHWERLTSKLIDTSKWKPVGFKFTVDNEGNFVFYIWATPNDASPNEKSETPVRKFKTNITWDEFSKSFVELKAQAFWGRQKVDEFYEVEGEEND